MEEKMKTNMIQQLGQSLNLPAKSIENVIKLLEEDNTIPFIARYRKELTGGLDEVQINEISDKWEYAVNLHNRKLEVVRLINEQDKLTGELEQKIMNADQLRQVEDLYRPYKQKKRTRASKAKEKGLEPLADWLINLPDGDPEEEAVNFIDVEKDVETVEQALQGARDIIAERVSDDARLRQWTRDNTYKRGVIAT